jgi:hypothetical protein
MAMPSSFIPLRLAYAEADLLDIDHEAFELALFSKLANGDIAAQSEQAFRSTLHENKFHDLDTAVAQLGISAMTKSGIARALKTKQEIAHFAGGNDHYITFSAETDLFYLLTAETTSAIPGPDIMPFYWDNAYFDRPRQTLISMDWRRTTRSIFYRVTINKADFRNSGLLTPIESRVRRGRASIYDNQACNEAFASWLIANRQVRRGRQIEKLREIYREEGLSLGEDESFKAEMRAIRSLRAKIADGPK